MNDSEYSYPVVVHWSLDGVNVPDIGNAQLKAWHLTLDTTQESYTFPGDLTEGFFAVPWSGLVKDKETRKIDEWEYQFFNILPNQTIERNGDSSAEIAIIGIVGENDPTFDPPLGRHSPMFLEFPAVNGNPLVATILLLDLNGSGSTPDSDSWVRPGYLVTNPDGPRVRPVPINGPASADDHDDPLVLVPVPANIGLTFEPGKSPTETVPFFATSMQTVTRMTPVVSFARGDVQASDEPTDSNYSARELISGFLTVRIKIAISR